MLGVIADDLTGAAELGGVGRRFGFRAEVVLSGRPGPDAELVCLDTDSRMCDADQAGRRAAAAAKALTRAGARWIYKKVDSVLRGQVTAELEAVMEHCRVKLALLVPANPSLGRIIRDGHYLVGGKPLHETEFSRDPAHPRRSSAALSLLGPSRKFAMCVRRVNEPLPTNGIVLGEAQTSADLEAWVARRDPKMLLAGGSEFFSSLLGTEAKPARGNATMNGVGSEPRRISRSTPARDIELFVCGSTSESSSKFIAAAMRRGTPAFSLPSDLPSGARFSSSRSASLAEGTAAALRSRRRAILCVGLPRVADASVAPRLSDYLIQVAAQVLRQVPVRRVYAEGGATAVELARTMGWKRLEVVREIAAGVTVLRPAEAGRVLLTIKPGTYVWPNEITGAEPYARDRSRSRKPSIQD